MPSNRRAFLAATTASVLTTTASAPAVAAPRSRPATAGAALDELLAGNRRYAAGRPRHPHEERARRHVLAAGQHPFAVVVAASTPASRPSWSSTRGSGTCSA